jgi:hypothetical protein
VQDGGRGWPETQMWRRSDGVGNGELSSGVWLSGAWMTEGGWRRQSGAWMREGVGGGGRWGGEWLIRVSLSLYTPDGGC